MAIQSFANRVTRRFFFAGKLSKRAGSASVAGIAGRKLDMLDYASRLSDLAPPPGNRLESLRGDRRGFHSIRLNDQWRVVFRWTEADPRDVHISDYHREKP